MNKKNQKGFTLLELIVVLAIIGIIAAILVPTIIRYTRKAAAKTDMANAKQIYNAVKAVLVEDQEAYNSFYQHNTMKTNVVVRTKNDVESYRLVVACKCNAADSGKASVIRPKDLSSPDGTVSPVSCAVHGNSYDWIRVIILRHTA